MNERLVCISKTLTDPDESAALSTTEAYFYAPVDLTIVYVSVAPEEDDASATLDIDDDGTNVITEIDASDADAPGTWKASGYGGTNAPVTIAAGSKISFDLNNAAAANVFNVDIWALTGNNWS